MTPHPDLDVAGTGLPDHLAAPLYGHLFRAALGPNPNILLLHGRHAHTLAAAVMAGYGPAHTHPDITLDTTPDPDQLCHILTTLSDTPLWLHTSTTTGSARLEDIAAFARTTPTRTLLATIPTLHLRRPQTGTHLLTLHTDGHTPAHPAPAGGYWTWLLDGYRTWITDRPPETRHWYPWLANLTPARHPVITGALAGWHAASDYQLGAGHINRATWTTLMRTVVHAMQPTPHLTKITERQLHT